MACELKMSADGKFHLYMLDRMRRQRQFFDAKIIMKQYCGQRVSLVKIVEAHKCVLASSGYFFYSKLKKNDTSKIDFDLSKEFWTASDLIAVIEFLYTGSITLSLDNILNITYLARLFGMTILENLCDKYATFFLSEKTFLPLYIALISNKQAISVSQKMMGHRDRLAEFVQTVFFSQLIENEQVKKLTSQQMLLLLENIVFDEIRNQDVLPVLKLAINWPLWHKDADSLKVCKQMINAALNIRLSDLSNIQRVAVEKLLQSTDENARLYYEICGAKLAVQFETYIQKAVDFVFGEIDEHEFNKVTSVGESTRTAAGKDNEVVPVQCLIADRGEVGMVTLENMEKEVGTDSQCVLEPVINPTYLIKTEPIDESSTENETKFDDIKIETPLIDGHGIVNAASKEILSTSEVDDANDVVCSTRNVADPSDMIQTPTEVAHATDMIQAPAEVADPNDMIQTPSEVADPNDMIQTPSEVADPNDMLLASNKVDNASAASLDHEHNAESDFEIKIELDIDSDEYNSESGKYSADQTELLLNTMKNNPHNYYPSGVVSGIAKQLSVNSVVMNVGMDQVNSDVNILSEIYKNRKREHLDTMCSKRTRSKLLNRFSKSCKRNPAGSNDKFGVIDGPSGPKHVRKDETANTDQLENLNGEKVGKNRRDEFVQPEDGSNRLMCCGPSDDETLSADEETVSATESAKDISESDFERTEFTNAEISEEGEGRVENNFYEYVLDQITHNIEDNT